MLLAVVALLLMVSPCAAQVYADVTLANGTLQVERMPSGAIQLRLRGIRFYGVEWDNLGAAAVVYGLRAQAAQLPADTQENTGRTKLATLTTRCGPASCWATITERSRLGTWRPRPNFTPALLYKLAAAVEAARLGVGAPWVERLQ